MFPLIREKKAANPTKNQDRFLDYYMSAVLGPRGKPSISCYTARVRRLMFSEVLPIVAMDLFINGPPPDSTPTRRWVYIQFAALHLGSSAVIITFGAVGWQFNDRQRMRLEGSDCAQLGRHSGVTDGKRQRARLLYYA